MESAPFQPPVNPAEALPMQGPAPIDVATAHAMASPEAAQANPLIRVAQKVGQIARNAWESAQVTVGMIQAGVTPERPAPAPLPATDPAEGIRWGKLLSRGARVFEGDILRTTGVVAGIGIVAVKALAARHGTEMGGNSASSHFQAVANVMPLAESKHSQEKSAAGWALGIGAVVVTASGLALTAGVRGYHNMRANRGEALRKTHQQPDIRTRNPRTQRVTHTPQEAADHVIADRQAEANRLQAARYASRRIGTNLVNTHEANPAYALDPTLPPTRPYRAPAGRSRDPMRTYQPRQRVDAVRPPAPVRLWRYIFNHNIRHDNPS